uniref:Phage protein D n=1 Tax=Candidatus Kentrum sp. TC TaxID=2126339 RepID=A0A450YW15_9GAMM|nr:MAG: hypothetical protein BECKTC1821E_GA0114239_10546 [Candidatus Kentron sp. TC]
MEKMSIPRPVFRVEWNGRDVTVDLSPYVSSVSYVDREEGESDTLEIRLGDGDGRFRGDWYPTKGDRLRLRFGYEGNPSMRGGDFDLDEVTGDGPPDVVALRGIAAGISRPLRTPESRAYENTTLSDIARAVALRLGLSLVGEIDPIRIIRETQSQEEDLAFLARVAGEYGYAFSARGDAISFVKRGSLRDSPPVLTLRRGDITRYSVTDKILRVARSASVVSHRPSSRETIRHDAPETRRAGPDISMDRLSPDLRAETPEQAMAKAAASLDAENEEGASLDLTLFGNPRLVAGVNFVLADMGGFGGVWHITESRHDMRKGAGYTTELRAIRARKDMVR